MKELNIALIGCGGICGAHLIGYRELYARGLKAFNIKATCDSLLENAKEKSNIISNFQQNKPKVYSDIENLLHNESIDAVDICLPHNVHHVIAVRCLEEGLHIIVEKPLAITMRAAKIVVEKAEKKNKTLAVAENYRWEDRQRAIWWAIKEGFIGNPRFSIWTHINWGPKPWGWREDKFVAGGSFVFDGGVHYADLDRYQLGKEAIEVFASMYTFDKIKEDVPVTVDDMTMAITRYEGEVYSQWFWTRAAPAKSASLRTIYGSKGALTNEGLSVQRENEIVEFQNMRSLIVSMMNDLSKEERDRFFTRESTNIYANELFDFYDAVSNNRKPEVDGRDAYKDMAIPLGLYESNNAGKIVKVKDIEELRLEDYQKKINEKLGI